MEKNSVTELLNKNEKAVLSSISKESKSISGVCEELNLDKSTVSNSARKLFGYGLVKILNEAKVDYRLSKLGKKYLKGGLPEFFVLATILNSPNISYAELNELPLDKDELSAAIGILRKNKAIKIEGNNIKADSSKIDSLKDKNELLSAIDSGKSPGDTDELTELVKRKIIERPEAIEESIEITPEGLKLLKSPNFNKNLVDKLNQDVIRNWKGVEFREYDLSARPPLPISGKRNITRQFISEVANTMVGMGFKEMQSNYAESSFWNFDVMLFRQDHPDRDIQDTVYINSGEPRVSEKLLDSVRDVYENGFESAKNNRSIGYRMKFDEKKSKILIMRGHTTATTFRYINDYISKNKDAPAKYFSISKVFRNDTPDSTHLPEFYQAEGIVYDNDLNVSDLIGYIKEFYNRIGIEKIRLKPTYNPYTEPSLEIQAFSSKLGRWLEVGNSGVFRPETLHPFGVTKNIIAWGFGFDRMLMLRLGIADMRMLYGPLCDLDFLRNIESRKLFGRLD
jgi:phenylalanyl-tRNA synthetase alpha chain